MYGTNTKGGISDLIFRLVSKEHILNSLQHTNGRTKPTDHMTLFLRWADRKTLKNTEGQLKLDIPEKLAT